MTTNAQKIQAWRDENLGRRLTTQIIQEVLGASNLREADLSWANLSWADLSWADLSWANLSWADLSWADLSGANLRRADLYGAGGDTLQVTGLHPYQAILAPTPSGWRLTIGCWIGTIPELRTLIAGDEWPEAEGDEIFRRRPLLEALAVMCDAHIAANPGVIEDLAERWADR